jgi:hypothetical protein
MALSLLGAADGYTVRITLPATFQFSPATSKSIDIPVIVYTDAQLPGVGSQFLHVRKHLCYVVVIVIHLYTEWFPCDNLSSSRQIFLNLIHNDPWHFLKVTINFWYCNPTRFQTRGPNVQKWMLLLFVQRAYFYLILIYFL